MPISHDPNVGLRPVRPTTGFIGSLIKGLIAGSFTSASLAAMAAFLSFFVIDSGKNAQNLIAIPLVTFIFTGLVALVLAAFPIGPIAALTAAPFYRRGFRTPWTFTILGAAAASVLPILLLTYELIANPSLALELDTLSTSGLILAWFAISGAIGGRKFALAIIEHEQHDASRVANQF